MIKIFGEIQNLIDKYQNCNDQYNDLDIKLSIKNILLCNESINLNCQDNEMKVPDLFFKAFLDINDEFLKEKIIISIDQLVSEVESNPMSDPKYIINLIKTADLLHIKRSIYDIALNNLYNLKYIFLIVDNTDIHLILIRYASSFEIVPKYKKKILKICRKNLSYPEYAPLAYRWAYKADHSIAIKWMDTMIDLIGKEKSNKDAILNTLKEALLEEWIYDILKDNLNFFINDIYPKILKFDLFDQFNKAGVQITISDYDYDSAYNSHPAIIIRKEDKCFWHELDNNVNYRFYESLMKEKPLALKIDRDLSSSIEHFEKLIKNI